MGNDLSYLMQDPDKAVLKNLSEMGKYLEELQLKLIEKESEYEVAKGEYEHYKNSVLPMAMFNAGVTSLGLMDGNIIRATTSYHCSPLKNPAARAKMAEWLRAHGGEHLIKEQAIVAGDSIEKLKASEIPYAEKSDMNTQSLKAFLVRLLESSPDMELQDIPEEFHLFKQDSVEIDVKE